MGLRHLHHEVDWVEPWSGKRIIGSVITPGHQAIGFARRSRGTRNISSRLRTDQDGVHLSFHCTPFASYRMPMRSVVIF